MLIKNWKEQDKIIKVRNDRRVFISWLHETRNVEDDDSALLSRLADVLHPLFQYLADGSRVNLYTGKTTLEVRAWLLLYAFHPALLDGESMSDLARRLSLTKASVHHHLRHLRETFPALRIDTESRKGHASDKQASNERHRIANFKNRSLRRDRILLAKSAA